MTSGGTNGDLRLGAWARAGAFVGLVARIEGGEVTLFHPGERQQTTVPRTQVEPVPAAAVTVTATVDIPLAHGLEEAEVRRWVGALVDETLREQARAVLAEAGMDEGAALPSVRLSVAPMDGGGVVCLCGRKAPAPDGAALPCPRCGREAVAPPGPRGGLGGPNGPERTA